MVSKPLANGLNSPWGNSPQESLCAILPPLMEDRLNHIARLLRAWGLSSLAVATLESAGPLALVCAQALYVTEPFFSLVTEPRAVNTVAQWLEQPDAFRNLAARLQEE